MTEKTLQAIVRGLAPVIQAVLAKSHAETAARLAVAESQLAALESRTKEYGDLRERVALVEARPVLPGPAGEPGPAGKDGADGKAGLTYQGVYQEGKQYEPGDVTTWAGSTWHCNEATEQKPGDGAKSWTLMVKRGRDGKDGANGRDAAPVVKVGA